MTLNEALSNKNFIPWLLGETDYLEHLFSLNFDETPSLRTLLNGIEAGTDLVFRKLQDKRVRYEERSEQACADARRAAPLGGVIGLLAGGAGYLLGTNCTVPASAVLSYICTGVGVTAAGTVGGALAGPACFFAVRGCQGFNLRLDEKGLAKAILERLAGSSLNDTQKDNILPSEYIQRYASSSFAPVEHAVQLMR